MVILEKGGNSHNLANRCMVADGTCIGYYAVLSDYDEKDDSFCIGHNQRIPSAKVEKVAFCDAMDRLIEVAQKVCA
jgi:hypothetical protein